MDEQNRDRLGESVIPQLAQCFVDVAIVFIG